MRLTPRGWWLLLLAILTIFGGLVGAQAFQWLVSGISDSTAGLPPFMFGSIPALVLLGLSVLIWILYEWLVFAWRTRLATRHLRVTHEVLDGNTPVQRLWAGRTYRVRVELRLERGPELPFAAVMDRVPFGARHAGGSVQTDGRLTPEEPLRIEYQIHCPAVGRVHFDGVRVRLADLQGFFYRPLFVRGPVDLRVLPVLTNDLGLPATEKHHNLLPPPGIHRLKRAGSGSELLDLRDYIPGDPPRTVAWKVSARRDRLITKEFESDVPIRCTLFLDTSNSVRLGLPGANALARVVDVAAAVVQASAGVRDLTGLCVFDDHQVRTTVRPARTKRHVAELLLLLADTGMLPPAAPDVPLEPLLRTGYTFAEETYPHLLEPELNTVPLGLVRGWPEWRQLGHTPSRGRRLGRLIGWGVLTILFTILVLTYYSAIEWMYDDLLPENGIPRPPDYFVLGAFLGMILLSYMPFLRLFTEGLPALFAGRSRKLARWRKQLAALLALRQGLGPGGLGRLLEDNREFSLALQAFLAEHHIPYQLPMFDEQGHYLYGSPGKIDVLARAVVQAIGKGHDNELFVLLVDLTEMTDHLDPLLAAVRLALARHHQVVVICPWPPDVPPPSAHPPEPEQVLAKLLKERNLPQTANPVELRPLVDRLLIARMHQEFHRIRQQFARLRVPVINARSGEPVALVLEHLDRLRGFRSRR